MIARRALLALFALSGFLGACSREPPSGSAPGDTASHVSAHDLSPADPKLARLYAQTCKTCHTNPSSGAPQTGDANAWAPRLPQGMPALVQHAISGYKAMPPMGSCMDCSEAEFQALIRFMSSS